MKITKTMGPLFIALVSSALVCAQNNNKLQDSLYISEVEDLREPDKVLHAEPLYIDLIRDLGARKGEREWNIGLGLTDNLRFDSYEALIEYEWAPINRLGLEVELPFTLYSPLSGTHKDSIPANRLNSIKVATQWSFLVNEGMATSMALGYIHELELSDFRSFGNPFIRGNSYNPFVILAKRWGNNFHSLLYTGPVINHHLGARKIHIHYQINTSVHYMIPGTRNFIGTEFNKTLSGRSLWMTMRPQMRVGVTENLLVGIVTGVPLVRQNERFSAFVRLIWEPGHRKRVIAI